MSLQGSFGTTAALFAGGVLFPVDAAGLQQVAGVHRFRGADERPWPAPVWRVSGSWPERAFHVGRGDSADVVSLWRPHNDNSRWLSTPISENAGARLLDADHYLDGSVLGLVAVSEYAWKLQIYHRLSSTALSPPSLGKPPAGARRCKTPLLAKRLASLPSGKVFALGYDCKRYENGARKLMLQHWTKGAREGVMTPLPAPLDSAVIDDKTALRAWSAHDVALGTDEGLAHFNGKVWEVIDHAPINARHGLARGSDGSLWVLSGGKLRTRGTAGETLQPAALPPETKVIAIADAPGPVPWVLAAEGHHHVLLGPASQAAVVTLPAADEIAAVFDGALPAATSACPTFFVPLRRRASPSQRFDDVRASIDKHIKNMRYGIVSHAGENIFGAIPASYYSGLSMLSRVKSDGIAPDARLCCHPATTM